MGKLDIDSKFNNSSNIYYGHGIGADNQELVTSIFSNGLRCSHEQLYFTTIELGQGSDKLFEKNQEMMNNWEHKGSKQIIIASMPLNLHIIDSGLLYGKKNSVFYYKISKEKAEELIISPGYYLKPEFVMGMYDANNKTFISNERYYENLPEEQQKRILEESKKQYIDILKENGFSITEYSQILEELNLENPLTPEEISNADKEVFNPQILKKQLNEITNNLKISDFEKISHSIIDDAEQKENTNEGWSMEDGW